nr:DUF2141 domain-containing protein [uncultured Carboxylicivirga sp.]
MKKLLISLAFLSFVIVLNAQVLSISFENVRNSKGVFRVGFFTSQKSYKEGNPVYYKTVPKNSIVNGMLTYIFNDIPSGIYGIVVLDDENSNDKTDYSWMIPCEGFGFSNYVVDKLKIPEFDDFDFKLGADCCVKIALKYLK